MTNDSKRFIFILGTPRSGTSWMSRTFELQTKACVLFEPDVPRRYESPWHKRITPYWRTDSFVINSATATDQARENVAPLFSHLDHVIRQQATAEQDVVVIKIPRLEKMPLLLERYQPSHVFFMQRSPYAVLNSYERFGLIKRLRPVIEAEFRQMRHSAPEFGFAYKFDRAKTLEQKHALLTVVRQRLAPLLLKSYTHRVVIYENLCFDPAEKFRKLFGWAGIDWSDDIAAEIRRRSNPGNAGSSFHSVERVSEERAFGWRKELSPAIVDAIRSLFAELGIDDDTPPLTIDERKAAALVNKKRRARLWKRRLLKDLYHLKLRVVGKE